MKSWKGKLNIRSLWFFTIIRRLCYACVERFHSRTKSGANGSESNSNGGGAVRTIQGLSHNQPNLLRKEPKKNNILQRKCRKFYRMLRRLNCLLGFPHSLVVIVFDDTLSEHSLKHLLLRIERLSQVGYLVRVI
jgi:hypothetical protein